MILPMALDIFLTAIILFSLALVTFLSNLGNNIILLIIALEFLLLAIALLAVLLSFLFDDSIPLLFSLYLLPIAGSESAIALTLLVSYYSFF